MTDELLVVRAQLGARAALDRAAGRHDRAVARRGGLAHHDRAPDRRRRPRGPALMVGGLFTAAALGLAVRAHVRRAALLRRMRELTAERE
ncbi:hypothetical protein JYK22_34005, partial [Nonomuraea sp. RK-328]|nr:hypothetical protein [Nonomuraea sp. RK-328]